LILTARDASLLLPTISSRCQVLALRPLARAQVESALIERWQVEPAQARLLAHLSGGRLGWAVRASTDQALLDARRERLDSLNDILSEGRAERLERAGTLAKESDALPELIEQWIDWWRDVLLVQNGGGERVANIDRVENLRDYAARFGLEQVQDTLKSLRATARYLAQNVNARLAMEVLLLKMPGN
jgi:DNA polymerase-3 subunit delta'